MKTVPGTEYLNIESEYISGPQSQENKPRIKPESNQGQNNLNDSESQDPQGYTESESLIICNYELASSFQVVKNDKHKFNPGRYLHKVFLTGVAQKCRSQSLPSCLEKRKCLPNDSGKCSTLEESSEQSSPLVKNCEQSVFESGSKEQSCDTWFKTWPERGVDKLINSKVGVTYKDDSNHVCKETVCKLDMPPNLTIPQCNFVSNHNHSSSSNEYGFSKNTFETCYETKSDTQEHKIFPNQVLQQGSSATDSEQISLHQNFNSCKPIPLNDMLDSIPLVYSPVTKQLHLVNKSECTGVKAYFEKNNDSFSGLSNLQEDVTDCKFNTEFASRPREESLFSSTVSSLSDNSPSTYEDSALGSLLDYADTCSLMSFAGCSTLSEESIGEKDKKKSFAGFFSR